MAKVVGRGHIWWATAGLLACALGGLLAVVLLQGSDIEVQQLRLRTERAELLQKRSEFQAERAQVASQFHQAQRALLTERAARLELEKILASTQSELGRTQDQLAFFEDLLPPGPQGALDIRALEIQQHPEGLQYRVLLMRSGKVTKHFVGDLQFVATGHCHNAVVASEQQMILQPLLAWPLPAVEKGVAAQPQQSMTQRVMPQQVEAAQTEAQQTALRLDFAQFQRGQGLLAIPPGFVPKSVTVRVLEGHIVLASRVVAL